MAASESPAPVSTDTTTSAITSTTTTTAPSLRKIEFHLARKPISFSPNINPSFKLETLNPNSNHSTLSRPSQSSSPSFTLRKNDSFDFFEDAVLAFRMPPRRIGAGLENLGNTCFLNSVLQCLTYTEPLVGYLQSGKHQTTCRVPGFCALCAINKHVSRALQSSGRSLAPKDLVSNLRCISRNFRNARQEDAHEYMIHLLESMHKCCLPSGVPAESPGAYEKSLVHRIFGGRLRSQVKCLQCNHCSNTFDPFLDLSLEIFKADSLYKALRHFTAPEQLDGGERQYKCERCKLKVRALKQLTVFKAPFVLTIHLKRFRSHLSGQKIDKKVQFGSTLDLKPFVTGDYEGDLTYTLYGVLVHAGWSTHSGHYYCFVRTSSGLWYSLDDNRVYQVSEKNVMEQKAYMLFYVRDRKSVVTRKTINAMQKENLITTLQNSSNSSSLSVLNRTPNNLKEAVVATSAVKRVENSKPSELLVQPNVLSCLKHEFDGAIPTKSSGSKGECSLLPKGDAELENFTSICAEHSRVRNSLSSLPACASFDNKKISESHPGLLKPSSVDCPPSVADGVVSITSDSLKDVTPATVPSDPPIQRSTDIEPCNNAKVGEPKIKQRHVDGSVFCERLLKKKLKKISKCKPVGMHLSTRVLYGVAILNSRRKKKCKQMKRVEEVSLPVKLHNGESDASASLPPLSANDVLKSKAQSQTVLASDEQPQKTVSSEAHCQPIGVFNLKKQDSILQNGSLKETTVGCWGGIEALSEEAKGNSSEVTIGHVLDEWDVEYDRGKRKKVRELKNDFSGPNVFQEVATKKAKLRAKTVLHNPANEPFRI